MSEIAVVTRSLGMKFSDEWVLRGLDCHVHQGSVYGLLGRNGAGKTTILDLLAGLIQANEGEISLFGVSKPKERRALAADLAYVDDMKTLYGYLTVGQMLAFARSLAPRWSEQLAQKYLKHVRSDQRIRSLSVGQRAQVSFALAAARRPRLLLMDEPGANLDAIAAQDLFRGLIEDCVNEGATVIISSHELEEMSQICDHVGILENGRLRCELSLDNLPMDYLVLTTLNDDLDMTGMSEIVSVRHLDGAARYVVKGNMRDVTSELNSRGATILNVQPASLRTLYFELLDHPMADADMS